MTSEPTLGGGHYLAFSLGDGHYAVDVSRVEVVLETPPITRVPRTKAHLRGVVNHRGGVIAVVDLKARLGMGESAIGTGSRVIVLRMDRDGEEVAMGMLADSVHDVLDLNPDDFEHPPRIGGTTDGTMVSGIAKKDGRFIVVVDVGEAFMGTEPSSLDIAVVDTIVSDAIGNPQTAGPAMRAEVERCPN